MARETDTNLDEPVVSEGQAKRGRWVRTVLLVGIPLALVVLIGLPIFSTLQPGYYERYPDMHVRMDNWRASTHARVGCIGCHVNPGVKGIATYAARSIPDFYAQLIFGPHETNLLTPPDKTACQKCHTGFRQVSPAGDLLIPHRAHVQVLNVNCVVCHKDLVHSANDQGFNRPEMSTCLDLCHDGVKASNTCTDCHTRKQTPETHSRPDWLKIHSEQAATEKCGECHAYTPDFCADCHKKRPASHKGNWKKDHQFRAKQLGKGCLVCHGGEKFCKKCHD